MDNRESAIHFLLVPDNAAARRLRRVLVEESARSGVVVGVWWELLALAAERYLLEVPAADAWHECFHRALLDVSDAFWLDSYAASPSDTAAVMEGVYASLLAESE